MTLTQRQQELVDFLRSYHRETGIMPSTREIQNHFGFSSQTAAVSHLKALEKKGVIKRLPGKARAVIFPDEVGNNSDLISVPIFGRIAAGMSTDERQEREGLIAVDPVIMGISRSADTFALKVRGDSMTGAHILDGDVVILENKDPRPRDIVAALIDGETSLKRFILDQQRPFLQAENPDYPNLIPAAELVIQGVMVGLMRSGGMN
ncbi:MAG: repressor LexA [Verrucomicrobiales bacterium]|jgi:repressor LexA